MSVTRTHRTNRGYCSCIRFICCRLAGGCTRCRCRAAPHGSGRQPRLKVQFEIFGEERIVATTHSTHVVNTTPEIVLCVRILNCYCTLISLNIHRRSFSVQEIFWNWIRPRRKTPCVRSCAMIFVHIKFWMSPPAAHCVQHI